ncbi:hypothetical protein FSP39_001700 [Pinctada imbricata]|uniref:Reverse transcriptase domain-containing protein n=1 Tax=Pinctada imbricata TaxID=66713 RepID=A0AA88YTD8_PINIB|nr:hypothetical protein FSP39_001700 [Pinctada imbricata]
MMKVVVEGECSREVTVDSGVPQGTVLGPLLFLCHINDLPDSVQSKVRLFADGCLLYREIRSHDDHIALKQDLASLELWAKNWGMRFNAAKCYVLSVRQKSNYFYQLNNTILKGVQTNPYLGVMLSADLKWTTHINNMCKKASATLGFIRRNLRHCPTSTRKTAYISLVRSTLEYGAIIWDPFIQSDIIKMEKIQRKAARFITGDYKTRSPGSVTNMLKNLDLQLHQDRRRELRLTFLFKVVEGLVPAIPPDTYLVPVLNKRRIRAKRFTDFEARNVVHSSNHTRCFNIPTCNSVTRKNSFFIRTVTEWNELDNHQVLSRTVEGFRSSLKRDSVSLCALSFR